MYGNLLLLCAASFAMSSVAADPIHRDLDQGRADDALQVLDSVLAQNPSDARAHNLRCRVYYEEQQWEKAIRDCDAAVKADPSSSSDHLWLGRAYGQKAAHSSLVSAYKLARKVAAEFEQAVQLDPRNADALADLGEFYVSAPGVVGGGVSRAVALVPQLQSVSPVDALALEARIAESRKDDTAAEADLKAAIAQSPDPAGNWMNLAAFYRRHHRIDDMIAAAHTGASLDRRHGSALVDGASDLDEARREPETAIQWLQQYLDSRAQSEDAPVFAVRAQLASLLAHQGDAAGAEEQLAAAHALASGYRLPSLGDAASAGR